MEVIKVYKEALPCVKLVGKRYTNKDRDEKGTFASYWQQCFQENWPEKLQGGKRIPEISDDFIGAMRMTDEHGDFEYWIGTLLAVDTEEIDGFASVEIAAGELGVVWLHGNPENGELYSMEASNLSMEAIAEKGWKFSEEGWFFERYNAPRFTVPDEQGNVILDICAYLI